MSGTEARTTDDGTTGTTESRDDASSAAERLGGPLEDEQLSDSASEGQADVGRRADTAADEGEQSPDLASEGQADVGRRADTTSDEGQSSETTTRPTSTVQPTGPRAMANRAQPRRARPEPALIVKPTPARVSARHSSSLSGQKATTVGGSAQERVRRRSAWCCTRREPVGRRGTRRTGGAVPQPAGRP